ncbi:MAG: tetratricopeptide repeat protein [bacterium]|nr:tetratricopeptide repeat protein [bacterium]
MAGYYDDARAYLEKSLPTVGSGDDPNAKLRRADVYRKLGDLEFAEKKFGLATGRYRQALNENPNHLPARIFLALSLAEAGQADEALGIAAKLKGAAPGNPNFINLEADVHRALGDDAKAVAGYHEVLAANRFYIPAIEALGTILATSPDAAVRDGAAAVKVAERLSQAPGAMVNPRFLTIRADAWAAKGNFSLALHEAQNALEFVLATGDKEIVRGLQARVASYKEKKPYHPQPD